LKLLKDGTTVLGAFHPLPFINEGFITDLDDFLYFSYTDGLVEALNEKEKEFGEERLIKFLKAHAEDDLKKIHNQLLTEVDQYRGSIQYNDDITMLSCRVNL